MTVPIHSFRGLRHSTLSLILLVAFAGITGCGDDNSSGGMSSPPDWVVLPSGGRHAQSATRDYIANGENIPCMECHGADLSGGTSMVSCFENPAGCHHGPVADWVVSPPGAQNHGVSAKQAPGSSGFVSCKICHGSDFRTPRGDGSSTCYSCHSLAPHPNGPWRVSAGSPYDHVTTDNANASTCYDCHAYHAYTGTANPNNPHIPPTPAPTGTAPGCYNGTMCHNAFAAPHASGAAWLNAGTGFHGTDAKADLAYCQECHGTPGMISFDGGSAPTACSTCHSASKAHPTDWQGLRTINGVTITHRTSGNRDVACAICHNVAADAAGPFAGAPSCLSATFGGSTCHSASPGGANHSVPFLGAAHTSADQTSFIADCSACHAITGVSPNAAAPLCTVCHQSAVALPFTNCTSCHGDPPTGAAYPNVAGKHAVHGALPGVGVCDPCHNGLEAGSLEHYDRANAIPGKNALRVPPGDVAILDALAKSRSLTTG
ncbi:hypothetical protein K0B90_12540 [bacterium]|nr:hypothetical protein [bacterium]